MKFFGKKEPKGPAFNSRFTLKAQAACEGLASAAHCLYARPNDRGARDTWFHCKAEIELCAKTEVVEAAMEVEKALDGGNKEAVWNAIADFRKIVQES